MQKKHIYVTPDGPYEVCGGVKVSQVRNTVDEEEASVEWVDGRQYGGLPETVYLCRCGHSGNKPFCDGTHEKVSFHGEETADYEGQPGDVTVYKGAELTLYDNEKLCASMRFCDRGENAWSATEHSGNEESRKLAVEEVCNCPSGRLTLSDREGNAVEPELEQQIKAIEDAVHDCRGPLWVQGGIPVESSECTEYERRNRVTLCRCGESQNKPFCDSSHVYCDHMRGFDEASD